jgi:hypothetical protein
VIPTKFRGGPVVLLIPLVQAKSNLKISTEEMPMGNNNNKLISFLACLAFLLVTAGPAFGQDQKETPKLKAYVAVRPASHTAVEGLMNDLSTKGSTSKSMLPLFTFSVESTRDGNNYTGVIVGANPFTKGGNKDVHVKAFIVPLIITLNSVGNNDFNPTTGTFTSRPGVTTFNPTVNDTACLGNTNNNPLTLLLQSPLLNDALFDVGGTIVGNTQHTDMLQRAEFWNALGNDDPGNYHLLLDPVTLASVSVNIPAASGVTLPTEFGSCAPFGIIEINAFDNLIQTTVLPALASQGVNSSNFPILLLHNVVEADAPITFIGDCCILGYHSSTSTVPFQTYSPLDFDSSGLFTPGTEDTDVMSHEVAEWANDPFGDNPTPAWGGTGQVPIGACQNNLEVGDPLTGTNFPPIVMPNGFTYHLQELAFFSWFFASPSVGIHGWFSDNGTFLSDAGPVCVPAPPSSGAVQNLGVIPPRQN